MIFNNPTMNPTMTTAVNTTANANVREITLTTKILNPKTKEDGTITGSAACSEGYRSLSDCRAPKRH